MSKETQNGCGAEQVTGNNDATNSHRTVCEREVEVSKQFQTSHNIIPSIVEIIPINAAKKLKCEQDTNADVSPIESEGEVARDKVDFDSEEGQVHKCVLCHENFMSIYLLRKHLAIHTDDKMKVYLRLTENNRRDDDKTNDSDKPNQVFKCEKCSINFPTTKTLMMHFKMHQDHRSFTCSICGEKFKSKTKFNVHIRIHIGEKTFECEKCLAKYSSAAGLKYHKKAAHTKEKPFHCTLCDEKFRVKATYESHLRAHTGEKPFYCELCEAKYGTKAGLRYHLKLHEKKELREKAENESKMNGGSVTVPMMDEIFHCTICDSMYKSRSGLKYHLMTHTGEKPYPCTWCDAKFTRKNVLKVHLRKHTGDTPHICGLCGTKYITKDGLKFHLLTHSDIKPFQCAFCNSTFTRKDLLKSHVRSHTGEKPYKCQMCNENFGWRSLLHKHIKKVHPSVAKDD